jgi:intein/homing endonuclease
MAKINKFGWVRDLPDQRDHVFSAPRYISAALPHEVDLRPQCPPVYDQLNIGSCFDSLTEVLTKDGWKLFSDLNNNEELATVDPITKNLIFEKPVKLIRFRHEGIVYHAKNRDLDFVVTPDHKMLVRKWNEAKRTLNEEYEFVEMKDIGWYSGLMSCIKYEGYKNTDSYILENFATNECDVINIDHWLLFLGIYLAEGTMLRQKVKDRHKIQLAEVKEREKKFIREVLGNLKIKYLELKDRFTFNNRTIYNALDKLGLRGIKAPFKFVPKFVFNLSGEHIEKLLLGHFMGDGCEQHGNVNHYTSSYRLAEDLQRLIFLSGKVGNIYVRPPRSSVMKDGRIVNGKYPEHRISNRKTVGHSSITRKDSVKEEVYEGEVFCAEMPTHHTLITRRNRKILISGNCTAQSLSGLAQFLMMKHNYPNYIPSRLFGYYNSRALIGTIDSDSGASIRDTFKVASSLGLPNSKIWWYNPTKFKVKPNKSVYFAGAKHKLINYSSLNNTDLITLKSCLAGGYPFVYGFTVYESFESQQVANTGYVPMPHPGERVLGGHAVCFTADTKVPLLDGRELTFRQLTDEYKNKQFWVYSCDDNGNIVPGLAHSPRMTNKSQKVIKITLDNNEEIKCTENHEFMLRNGNYKKAIDLTIGESLMPLYRKLSTEKEMSGYDMVLNPSTNRWRYTHRIIASKDGRYEGVVHHKDFNKLNNDPTNLEIMTWKEHTKLHLESYEKLSEYAKSEEGRNKSRKLMIALWADEGWRSKTLERNIENGRKTSAKLLAEGRNGFQAIPKDKLRENSRINGSKNHAQLHTEKAKEKSKETRKKKYDSDPKFRENVKQRAIKNLMEYNNKLASGEIKPTEKQIAARRLNGKKSVYNKFYKDKYSSFEEYLQSKCQDVKTNHKVIRIEECGSENVYDLTVDKYHNFALSAGVFVHNCAVGYNDALQKFIVRNSWSKNWGQNGYFFMDYQYLTNPNLADDFWSATDIVNI